MKPTTATTSKQFLEYIRELQRLNSAISPLSGTRLSLADSHSLVEVIDTPAITTIELAKRVGIDQSSASRVLRRLTERKILKKVRTANTARYDISASGKNLIEYIDQDSNARNQTYAKRLSATSFKQLCTFLSNILDRINAPHSATLPSDHPFRPIQRRIARVTGMTKGFFAGSKLAILHWHLLSELHNKGSVMSLDHILAHLSVDRAILVAALFALKNKGFIESKNVGFDARRTLYSITPRGSKELEDATSAFCSLLEQGLKSFPEREVKKMLELFATLLETDQADKGDDLLKEYSLRAVQSDEELQELRALYMEWSVREGTHKKTPSLLFAPIQSAFALYNSQKRIVACAQVEFAHEKAHVSASARAATLPTPLYKEFVRRCLEEVTSGFVF